MCCNIGAFLIQLFWHPIRAAEADFTVSPLCSASDRSATERRLPRKSSSTLVGQSSTPLLPRFPRTRNFDPPNHIAHATPTREWDHASAMWPPINTEAKHLAMRLGLCSLAHATRVQHGFTSGVTPWGSILATFSQHVQPKTLAVGSGRSHSSRLRAVRWRQDRGI